MAVDHTQISGTFDHVIKNVGAKMVDDIILERERNGEYKDFVDFSTVNSKDT